MNPQQPRKRQIKLELPQNPGATYSNTVMISHTPNEFIFDFIQIMPNDPRARVQSRVVMTPLHAKLFLKALEENIRRYEEKNGEIKMPPRPQTLADQLFQGIGLEPDGDDNDT